MHDTKPHCKLTDTDGNVFCLASRVSRTLKRAGQPAQAQEMSDRLRTCQNYDAALMLFMEYVDID